jgi:Cu-Zn family superoxide dismutase
MNRFLARLGPTVAILGAVGLFVTPPAFASADRVRSDGPLVAYSSDIQPGASARVQAVYDASGSTTVMLHVWGMRPNTNYGAHAHVNACGLTGAAAGPHFQHVQDPISPSVNPAYANPRNEIWLDLVTDEEGSGVAQTRVPWQFQPDRRAHSVIIHAEHTHTGPSDSGVAGARLACVTTSF